MYMTLLKKSSCPSSNRMDSIIYSLSDSVELYAINTIMAT